MNYYTLPKDKIHKLLRNYGIRQLIMSIIWCASIIGICVIISKADYVTSDGEVIEASRVSFSEIYPIYLFFMIFLLVGLGLLVNAFMYLFKYPNLLDTNPEKFISKFRVPKGSRRDYERDVYVFENVSSKFHFRVDQRNLISYLILKWEEEEQNKFKI